ncbi:MAG: hypothetical protein K2I33_03910 [Oscillospiraceae bacterium]|nr:hypothetical protein [Oscillospiraceae bacterium]
MKKGKFLSILTTIAITGSMMLSAVPFTASAKIGEVRETKAELSMTADKTTFTLDEVKAGATARVKVHMTGDFAGDNLQTIEGKFDCSDSDWKVVPTNMILSSPLQIANNNGSKVSNFRGDSNSTYSIWTKELPVDPESARGNKISYATINEDYENGNEAPSFKIFSDLSKGNLKPGEGDSIFEFDVE